MTGAAIVFFAYIGFDIVATTAEETKNPQRDMPIGILGSLVVCTVLYIAVSLILTGIVSYKTLKQLNTAAPMATAFEVIGKPWAAGLVSIGAICGLTAVIMILMMGQSRVFFAMSRDHLLPPWFARVHPSFGTPYRISILTGVIVAFIAAFTPIGDLAELVNIGTLLAFILVSAGVLILRKNAAQYAALLPYAWSARGPYPRYAGLSRPDALSASDYLDPLCDLAGVGHRCLLPVWCTP
ncbi:hypothetical protein KSC_052040 [Ktedonobacter sp. SOSP1-52]|nr:hypothetical protein KSC_052040 [Ktedonobacter sp. SOSP1-52]